MELRGRLGNAVEQFVQVNERLAKASPVISGTDLDQSWNAGSCLNCISRRIL
jgi:ethanolamine ammonia-lyase large subunit